MIGFNDFFMDSCAPCPALPLGGGRVVATNLEAFRGGLFLFGLVRGGCCFVGIATKSNCLVGVCALDRVPSVTDFVEAAEFIKPAAESSGLELVLGCGYVYATVGLGAFLSTEVGIGREVRESVIAMLKNGGLK